MPLSPTKNAAIKKIQKGRTIKAPKIIKVMANRSITLPMSLRLMHAFKNKVTIVKIKTGRGILEPNASASSTIAAFKSRTPISKTKIFIKKPLSSSDKKISWLEERISKLIISQLSDLSPTLRGFTAAAQCLIFTLTPIPD